jgi:hypothetical protein
MKHLRRARSGRRKDVRQRAALVRGVHRIVGDRGIPPHLRKFQLLVDVDRLSTAVFREVVHRCILLRFTEPTPS